MQGIAPRDEMEAMLIAMVATHKMIMRLTSQFQSSNTILQQNAHGNTLTKLQRTYTAQMEGFRHFVYPGGVLLMNQLEGKGDIWENNFNSNWNANCQ